MDKRLSQYKVAVEAFQNIRDAFPNLIVDLNTQTNDSDVELEMNIELQEGLDFGIYLNFQNKDQLHMWSNIMCFEYFPANEPEIVKKFTDAVIGIISGNYRVLQKVRNSIPYTAYLQNQEDEIWITIYTHHRKFKLPWLNFDENIIQNNCASKILSMYDTDRREK